MVGYMKAIATDVEELVLTIANASSIEQIADLVRENGWISPTEADLVRSLIADGYTERALRILGGT